MIKISARGEPNSTREATRETVLSGRGQGSRAHMHTSKQDGAIGALDSRERRHAGQSGANGARPSGKNAASLHVDSSNVRDSTRRTAGAAIRQQNSDGHNMLLPVRTSMYNGKKSVSSHRSRPQESGSLSSRRKTQNQNAEGQRVASLKPVALPRRQPSRDDRHNRNAENLENGHGHSRSSMPSVRSKSGQ